MSAAQTSTGWVRRIAPAPAGYNPAGRPGLPRAWWRANPRYTLYMLRELSSIFNALWALRLLLLINQMRRGRDAYEAAVAAQRRPHWLTFHLIALLFATLHSATFLLAAGKGPTMRAGDRRISERAVATGAFAGWAAASLTVLLVLLRGGRDETA
jgi:fumarate reductase subunit C